MKRQGKTRNAHPVFVITGTPGTGKTTISAIVAKRMTAEHISVTKLVRSYHLQSRFDYKRRSRVVNLVKTRATLRKLLHDRRRVVLIDTHLPDAVPRGMVERVVVLRCDPRILKSRLKAKGWAVRKVQENVLAEMLDSCLVVALGFYGAKRVVQLDTSRSDVENTVKRTISAISGRAIKGSKIDWIGTLERQNTLPGLLV